MVGMVSARRSWHREDGAISSCLMSRSALLNIARAVALALVGISIYRIAWLSDDALITLRTALNTSHGWGVGFNATEAVQGYTHPMWFLLWLLIGGVTNQWIIGILVASIVLTVCAVALLLWQVNRFSLVIFLSFALITSNAFIEYATSGLENSMGYLVFAVLILMTYRISKRDTDANIISGSLLGLTVAAAFLTRMDFIVIMAVPLLFIMWQMRTKALFLMGAGVAVVVPLGTWFVWSKYSYDSWLPNTFEAKRNVNIPTGELLTQGWQYFVVSFRFDWVSLIVIISGLLAALWIGRVSLRMWAIGVMFYFIYVASFGGDFMVGRYIAVPVLISSFLVALSFSKQDFSLEDARIQRLAIPVLALALSGSLVMSLSSSRWPVALANPQYERWSYFDYSGIADERGFYLAEADRSLNNVTSKQGQPFELQGFIPPVGAVYAKSGLREIDRLANSWPHGKGRIDIPIDAALVCGLTGSWGIVTGPDVHLIDLCGLTDRFIAQQTYKPNGLWRPGHFQREVPVGYEQAIRLNDPLQVTDPLQREELRQLWSDIRK